MVVIPAAGAVDARIIMVIAIDVARHVAAVRVGDPVTAGTGAGMVIMVHVAGDVGAGGIGVPVIVKAVTAVMVCLFIIEDVAGHPPVAGVGDPILWQAAVLYRRTGTACKMVYRSGSKAVWREDTAYGLDHKYNRNSYDNDDKCGDHGATPPFWRILRVADFRYIASRGNLSATLPTAAYHQRWGTTSAVLLQPKGDAEMDTFRMAVGETVPIYRLSACRDESLWPRQVLGTIRKKITDSTEAADTFMGLFVSRMFRDLMLEHGHNDRENLMIAAVDNAGNLTGVMLSATGSDEEVTAGVTTILRSALQMGAYYLVIGHNHPNAGRRKRGKGWQYYGLEPSEPDIRFTTRLYGACSLVGIQLVDHLILGVVDPRKYRSGDEQVFLSMWGSGYFKKHVFPAVAGQTVSDYSPEVAVAIRRQKRLPGKGGGEKKERAGTIPVPALEVSMVGDTGIEPVASTV